MSRCVWESRARSLLASALQRRKHESTRDPTGAETGAETGTRLVLTAICCPGSWANSSRPGSGPFPILSAWPVLSWPVLSWPVLSLSAWPVWLIHSVVVPPRALPPPPAPRQLLGRRSRRKRPGVVESRGKVPRPMGGPDERVKNFDRRDPGPLCPSRRRHPRLSPLRGCDSRGPPAVVGGVDGKPGHLHRRRPARGGRPPARRGGRNHRPAAQECHRRRALAGGRPRVPR